MRKGKAFEGETHVRLYDGGASMAMPCRCSFWRPALRRTGVLLSSFLLAHLPAFADGHVWIGGDSAGGGWNVAENWQGGAIPSAGDDVTFGDGTSVRVVVNDDDAALFCSLRRVHLNGWDAETGVGQVIVLDVSTNVTVNCAWTGVGQVVKRGVGEAELASTWTDSQYMEWNRYRVYDVAGGGLSVEAGVLVLPQDRGIRYIWNRALLHIAKGATVVTSVEREANGSFANTLLYQLAGEGTLLNRSGSEKGVNIGRGWVSQPSMAVFAGKVSGPLKVLVYGRQGFIGRESDTTSNFLSYGGQGRDNPSYGVMGVGHFGKKGQPSSVGTRESVGCFYGGGLLYLGDGETTDRWIDIDTRQAGTAQPIYIDGGAAGGLRIEGRIEWNNWGNDADDRWLSHLILTGSNAAPCTIAGPYRMSFESPLTKDGTDKKPFSFYTIKKGTGVWRFEHNENSTYRGAFDVREGTLQFNTLSNSGERCALGTADLLTDGMISKWDEARFCDVAMRLGGDGNAAVPTLEYVGSVPGVSTNRHMVLNGNAALRASGETAAAMFVLGDVTALASVGSTEKTLTVGGENVGANTLRDFAEEDGVRLSIVKDGAGTWHLDGRMDFSGDLKVRNGNLVVRHGTIYRYFKIAFTDGYRHPNGIYVREVALYDASGVRRNLGLTFAKPDDVAWNTSYTPVAVAPTLGPGTLAWDSYEGKAYRAYTYMGEASRLENLCDGTTAHVQFIDGFPEGQAAGTYCGVISMRLADDTPEIAYMDFCQCNGQYHAEGTDKYQTASAFVLQGSADGVTWKTLVEQSGLPINASGTEWYYSAQKLKVNDVPSDRTLGNGEGLAFSSRALDLPAEGEALANVRSIEVSPGATLTYSGIGRGKIARLTIDAATGAGTIRGFDFAEDVVIDVVNIPDNGGSVAVDFGDVGNLGQVRPRFTQDGGRLPKFVFTLTDGRLTFWPLGLRVILK